MSFWSDFLGTTESIFRIGLAKLSLDASGLTAPRTLAAPDKHGTIALTNDWIEQTASYAASAGDKLALDSTLGPFTVTLPAAPASGDAIVFKSGPAASLHAIAIARNGGKLMGLVEDMAIDLDNVEFRLVFDGTTWRL